MGSRLGSQLSLDVSEVALLGGKGVGAYWECVVTRTRPFDVVEGFACSAFGGKMKWLRLSVGMGEICSTRRIGDGGEHRFWLSG